MRFSRSTFLLTSGPAHAGLLFLQLLCNNLWLRALSVGNFCSFFSRTPGGTRPHFRLNVFQKCRPPRPEVGTEGRDPVYSWGANVRCVCVCPHRAVHSSSGCLYSMHFGQSFHPYWHSTFVMPRFFRTTD